MKQAVIVNVGVSGVGKSSWSANRIARVNKCLRINRDDIRRNFVGNLEGYYKRKDLNFIERQVNILEEFTLVGLLKQGYDVIIDSTNLKKDYIDRWVDLVDAYNKIYNERVGGKPVEIVFNVFKENDPTTLKERIGLRDSIKNLDDLKYIDKQIQSLGNIIKYLEKNYPSKTIIL